MIREECELCAADSLRTRDEDVRVIMWAVRPRGPRPRGAHARGIGSQLTETCAVRVCARVGGR